MLELFDENHFFICSGGMKPARFKANQNIASQENGNYYLTIYSLRCKGIDFACRWMALLVAIIAAAMALLMACGVGWILLAAILGAAAGAGLGAMICGDMAAILRTWVVIKTDAEIQGYNMVPNRPGVHMNCKFFGNQITFVPNVTSEFHALFMFAMNIGFTGLEGFMYVYAARGVGLLVSKPAAFVANFGTNYLKSITAKGLLVRSFFAAWSGFDAYSRSETEGFHAGEVLSSAAQGFGFIETAAYNAITKGDFQSIAMLLSLGGIPGARESNYNSVKDLGTDRAAWANEAKTLGNELKAEAAKTRASYQKIIDVAKEFRDKLKGQEDGVGAIEKGFSLELRELVEKDALELISDKKNGPVTARAIDTKTGKISERYVNVKEVPADLDPILMDRINKLNELGQEKHHSKPGTHAEILAVDELLKARRAAGETVTEKTLNDIITDQYWLDIKTGKPNNGINPAPTCGNCTEILRGTTSQAGANE